LISFHIPFASCSTFDGSALSFGLQSPQPLQVYFGPLKFHLPLLVSFHLHFASCSTSVGSAFSSDSA